MCFIYIIFVFIFLQQMLFGEFENYSVFFLYGNLDFIQKVSFGIDYRQLVVVVWVWWFYVFFS